MPDSQWIPAVRSAGVLRFERGRTLGSGAWPAAITASVTEINALLRSRRVDLRFEEAGESSAQLQIQATSGPIPAHAGGGTLHSSGRDGLTRLAKVGRSGAPDSRIAQQSQRESRNGPPKNPGHTSTEGGRQSHRGLCLPL
jgi:hypothetical protein